MKYVTLSELQKELDKCRRRIAGMNDKCSPERRMRIMMRYAQLHNQFLRMSLDQGVLR